MPESDWTTFTRRSLLISAALVASGLAGRLTLSAQERSSPEALRRRARELGAWHGLQIRYADAFQREQAYGSESGGPPADVEWLPIRPEAVAPALDGLEWALASYPPQFVSRWCQVVFLCSELSADGERAGGTYGPDWILISADDHGAREHAALALHHELASFFWDRDEVLQPLWREQLPDGWAPLVGTRNVLRAGQEGRARLAEGFLRSYGATNASNDFSTYAELVFRHPRRLRALAGRFPVIRRKTALLMGAYAQVDARMSDVFVQLGLGSLA